MKVHGPYLRKDGRKHVVIIHDDGKRQTQSYPRYLMEQHLGRELLKDEEVDHIDNDFTNDSINNLQLLSKVQNRKKEMSRDERKAKMITNVCPQCEVKFNKPESYIKKNQKRAKAGPFCGKSCAGTYYALLRQLR